MEPFIIGYILFISLYGCLTSYTDYRSERISNKLILIGLGVAVAFNSYFILTQQLLLNQLLPHVLFSVFVGFFIYVIDMWPAGDGKLFIILSLLLLPRAYAGLTSSVNILINTFVPLFFVFSAVSLVKMKKEEAKKAFNYSFSRYRVFIVGIMLFGFVSFVTRFLMYLGLPGGYFVSILLLFIGFEALKSSPINLEYLFIGLAGLRAIIDFRHVFQLSFVFDFCLLLVTFLTFRFFFLYLGYLLYTEEKTIEELEAGMRPAEGVSQSPSDYEKISFLDHSLLTVMSHQRREFVHAADALTAEDVNRLKQLAAEGKLKIKTLRIYKSLPFAIFLFLGFLLTLLARGSIFDLII